jgi:hypothetical protein
MKRTLIIPLMVCLLVGVTACQISLPSKDPGVTKTLLADTPAQPTQTAAEPLAPTETPSAEPTFTPTNPPPSPTVDPVLDPSRLVVESRNHLEENTALPGFRINSTFPVFTSPIDVRLTRFNGDVEELINNLETSFRTDAIAIPYDPNFGTNQSSLDITYQATYFQWSIISIYFGINYYMSGAAHPNGYSLVLNYDLLQGSQINLADLFLPGLDYLQAISDISTTTLSNEGRLEFPEGALPDEVNYKSWNITPTGLRITFDPYQVGPYAMGFQVVDIPYADLSSILRSDGAIGRMLAP